MELFFLTLLIVLMATALASGYPVAFALPGSAIVTVVLAAVCGYLFAGNTDAFFAQGGPSQWLSAGVTNLRGVYWEVERDTLIAIPLFIFMGIMLQRSKIAEDLLITMAQLFGPVRGGLGISVVFVGALLAATTGILGATVVAMGLISLPAMLRNGYSKSLASGTIAASGTLGQIIPPSIVLIILADQLASAVDQAGTSRQNLFKDVTGELSMPSEFGVVSTSAGEMFLGAFVPGLVLVGLYMTYIFVIALVRPKVAPAVQREGAFNRAFMVKVGVTLVPPLALIFLVLGSIISGIATVNQAGAIGAAGALLMAGYRLREGEPGAYRPALLAGISLVVIGLVLVNYDTNIKNIGSSEDAFGVAVAALAVLGLNIALVWSAWRTFKTRQTLQGVMVETAKTTSLVFIILLGAAMLTAAFRAFGGEEIVKQFLNGLPGGFWTQFIIVMGVIFLLGFFLDFIEIAVVVVPIVAPILLADPSANVTAVWLGVMIGLNIQTSFLTPPFGFALFYLRGVAPAIVRTLDMYKGVIAFIVLQLVALGIVGYYPALVNYLPNRVSLTSETAPPPRNPKLQYCIEHYVAAQYSDNGAAIAAAIERARSLDLRVLPNQLATELSTGMVQAAEVGGLLDQVFVAEGRVNAAAAAFRPLHTEVRRYQRIARNLDNTRKRLAADLNRLQDGGRRVELQAEIARAEAEASAWLAKIPNHWEQTQAEFQALQKAERDARNRYRRAADKAYQPLADVLEVLRSTGELAQLETELRTLRASIRDDTSEDTAEQLSTLVKRVSAINGTGDIRAPLSKARSALKAGSADTTEALARIDEALAAYSAQMLWREQANRSLLTALESYEAAIRDTIGMRQQARLSRDQALFVAGCSADHRDISLHF